MSIISIKKNIVNILILNFLFINLNNLKAQEAYFDLSEDNIKIETDFNGKEIIIFGLLEDDNETILTITGPKKQLKIQKKERFFGFWFNSKQITYYNVPSIFFLASSSKIEDILSDSTILKEGLSFNHILENKNYNQNFVFENNQKIWNDNFIRINKNKGLFKIFEMKKIKNKLFQTRVFFPSNTIPGNYTVNIYQIKNNMIVGKDNKTIIIKKSGIGSQIYYFANNHSAAYGFFAIIFAIISGLIAATAFRRI